MKRLVSIILFSFLNFLLIYGCAVNTDQLQIGEKIAPGTAETEARLIAVTKEKDLTIAELKITKVLGYGQGASPIAANSTLNALAISEDVIKKLKTIPTGSKIQIVLKLNSGGLGVTTKHKWELTQIISHIK